MRTRFFGFLVLALLMIAGPVQAEEPVTIDSCANPATGYASLHHPYECAGLCVGSTSEQVSADPSICPKCFAISGLLIGAPVSGPVLSTGVATWNDVNCLSTLVGTGADAAYYATCPLGRASRPGCCMDTVKAAVGGVGLVEKETCKRNAQSALANETEYEIWYGDCHCAVNSVEIPIAPGKTYDQCVEHCASQEASMITSIGVGVLPRPGAGGPSASDQQFINALCFTREQCSSPEYGGSADAFVPSTECREGKGKCLAPEAELELSSQILGVKTIKHGLREYLDLLIRYMLSIVTIVATIMFVWSGFRYIIASSMGSVKSAKETMINAVIGLLLSFGGFTLLNTLNPATTRLDRLSVYLINKQEYVEFEYCRDYKQAQPTTGDAAPPPLMFANVESSAGAISYNDAKFTVEQKDTMCNSEYYPVTGAGRTCRGVSCPESGQACLRCSEGLEECHGNEAGFACVKATIAGNIKFQDDREPIEVYAIAVCENFSPTQTFEQMEDQIPKVWKLDTVKGKSSVVYRYSGDTGDFNEIQAACNGKGGLRGILFGVVYKDTETSIAKSAAEGAVAGAEAPALGGATVGAVVGGATGAVTMSDIAIVTHQDCGTSGLYAAYLNGDANWTSTKMKNAIFCGSRVTPNQQGGKRSPKDTFMNPAAFWSAAEVQAAFSGEADPIQCNFFLNNANAPSDPGTKLMAGCE